MNFIDLNDTIELMGSSDYKDRFQAEYYQLAIRRKKLVAMLEKWDDGELSFQPTCPRELYIKQVDAMDAYLEALIERAEIEHVEIEEI